jgi:hypothetical protein
VSPARPLWPHLTSQITIYGWSTDVERLVKAMVLPGRRQNFGVDEVTALARAELLGVLYDWV